MFSPAITVVVAAILAFVFLRDYLGAALLLQSQRILYAAVTFTALVFIIIRGTLGMFSDSSISGAVYLLTPILWLIQIAADSTIILCGRSKFSDSTKRGLLFFYMVLGVLALLLVWHLLLSKGIRWGGGVP
jgi:hypothetical protein